MKLKADFPFTIAFILALCLHLVAGVALKYGRLSAAVPVMPPSQEPVTLNFVEVPPNATTVPQAPPNAKYASDANRKAGPLRPNRSEMRMEGRPSARPGPPVRSAPSRPAQSVSANRPAPVQAPQADSTPAPIGTDGPQISSQPPLSKSLQDLDRYIPEGGSGGGSQGSAGGDGGDLPTGDPGSGVFFDTQGYDLGPWANRAVEIVRSNWIIPVAAELGMRGVVGISFKIERDGTIRDLKIVSQSGVPSFDQAALSALQSSSPLPALPADFPRDILPGVFRFYYNTPVPRQ